MIEGNSRFSKKEQQDFDFHLELHAEAIQKISTHLCRILIQNPESFRFEVFSFFSNIRDGLINLIEQCICTTSADEM